MPTPSKSQADCDRLLRNLSQAEVTTLIAALDRGKTHPYTSLFSRADYLWQRPLQGRLPPTTRMTTLPADLLRLTLDLEKRAKERRDGWTTNTIPDSKLDDGVTLLRIYTVANLKVTERDAVKENLKRLVAAKDALRGSTSFIQRRDVEGIIHRTKGMVIELEEM